MLLSPSDLVLPLLPGLDPRTADTIGFFLDDTAKILVLLGVMIFAIGVLRTWLPLGRLRSWMGGRNVWANAVAAVFGAVTPFCSCSSIPIFIGLLKAGVHPGPAFSFLLTSPLINEYLVIIMAGEFGVPVTAAYVAAGLAIGISAGTLLGRMDLAGQFESGFDGSANGLDETAVRTWTDRLRAGWRETVDVLRQIWIWVLVGVGVGAIIHNHVPEEVVRNVTGSAGILSVPLATLLGIPMYGSCAAIVPVAVVLFQKGIPLGTALAFMMAMAALSLPEAIMLRRVMRLRLIGLYFGITALGIVATGYLLNALQGVLAGG
jgi:uncharacterized protein